jgi:hypothetical protein
VRRKASAAAAAEAAAFAHWQGQQLPVRCCVAAVERTRFNALAEQRQYPDLVVRVLCDECDVPSSLGCMTALSKLALDAKPSRVARMKTLAADSTELKQLRGAYPPALDVMILIGQHMKAYVMRTPEVLLKRWRAALLDKKGELYADVAAAEAQLVKQANERNFPNEAARATWLTTERCTAMQKHGANLMRTPAALLKRFLPVFLKKSIEDDADREDDDDDDDDEHDEKSEQKKKKKKKKKKKPSFDVKKQLSSMSDDEVAGLAKLCMQMSGYAIHNDEDDADDDMADEMMLYMYGGAARAELKAPNNDNHTEVLKRCYKLMGDAGVATVLDALLEHGKAFDGDLSLAFHSMKQQYAQKRYQDDAMALLAEFLQLDDDAAHRAFIAARTGVLCLQLAKQAHRVVRARKKHEAFVTDVPANKTIAVCCARRCLRPSICASQWVA